MERFAAWGYELVAGMETDVVSRPLAGASGAPFYEIKEHLRIRPIEDTMRRIGGAVHDGARLNRLFHSRNNDFAAAFGEDQQLFFRVLMDIVGAAARLDSPSARRKIL